MVPDCQMNIKNNTKKERNRKKRKNKRTKEAKAGLIIGLCWGTFRIPLWPSSVRWQTGGVKRNMQLKSAQRKQFCCQVGCLKALIKK
jgi:hypothetical protein